MSTPATFSLAETAARCGVSAARMRKAWKTWCKNWAFPAPIMSPPLANYSWDKAGLEAWIEARQRALGPNTPSAPRFAANEDLPPPRPEPGSNADKRLRAERAELQRLMENA